MRSKQLSLFYSDSSASTPASFSDTLVSTSAVPSQTSSEPASTAAQAFDEARLHHTLLSV